jgi:hypothetical protein
MTVASAEAKAGPYTGNDIATTFAFAFKIFSDADIRVVETLISTGAETDLVLNGANGFTVTKNIDQDNNPGGFITYKQASVTTPLPSTKKLTIVGDYDYNQPTDLPNGGPFFAQTVENSLDRTVMQIKQLKEQVDRAVKVDVSSTADPGQLFDDVLNQASASANAAAASAAAALVSETNAAASYDAFDDRFLGPKSSAPTLDNDGNALLTGALYWNTSNTTMFTWSGSAWLSLPSADTANVTHFGDNLSTLLKDASVHVVDTYAALRGTSKTKYTRALVLSKTTLGDGGFSWYYMDPVDTTTADNDFSVIVGADGGRWKRFRLMWQTVTGGADAPVFQYARNTTHTGGTAGVVCNALNVSATVGAGVTNYEWAFLAQMDNSAGAGENVAVYAQAIKRARGPTWAGCFEIQDKNGDDPAQGGALGIELAVSANGADTSFQRIGLHVAMGKNNAGGSTCEWGTGIYTGAGSDSRYARAFYNDGPTRLGVFYNAADSSNGALAGVATFLDTGKSTYGIDLSAATYTGVAIRMAAGQGIAFDTTGSPARIRKAGSNLAFENVPALFSGGRTVMNNGFGIPSSGNTAASATAGSSGATPAQVAGYLIFQLDGSNFKIPYYGP